MKKTIVTFLMILLVGVVIIPAPAFASFGFFKPDSKMYFLQPALESIRMFFTFSKSAKVDYLVELAERRTDEMSIAPSNEIANRYINHFQELELIMVKVPDRGVFSEEKAEKITEKIKEDSLRQQEVLAKTYSQAPEQAQEAILNAQENSAKHVENLIKSVQGEEEAQTYMAQAEQIRQTEKIEKQERIQQAPMESSPQEDPSKSAAKELNEGKSLNPAKELSPLNQTLEGNNQGEEGGGAPRVAPAPQEQPIQQR